MRKILKWIGVGLLAIMVIMIFYARLINYKGPDKTTTDPTITTTEPITDEELIRKIIEEKIGKRAYRSHSKSYIDKVKNIEIANNILFIELSADENVFGRNMEKFGINSDIIEVMRALKIPNDVERISFKFYYPARDENYNYYEAVVMSGWIEKDKFDINWSNVYDTDLPNIMFDVYWHPDF